MGQPTSAVAVRQRIGPGRFESAAARGVLDADPVVVADGIGSKARSLLVPARPGPVYSGSTVLRVITEQSVELRTDFELTWGQGAEFGHIAFRDGRAEWHAVLDLPAGARFPARPAQLRQRVRTGSH